MESQGIKLQKKYREYRSFLKNVLLLNFFLSLLQALFSLLLLLFSSFCICAFFHSSPWLCTE